MQPLVHRFKMATLNNLKLLGFIYGTKKFNIATFATINQRYYMISKVIFEYIFIRFTISNDRTVS